MSGREASTLGTLSTPSAYVKAIVAGILAGLGSLVTALTDEAVSPTEWVLVASAAVTAFAAVFGVRNSPPS